MDSFNGPPSFREVVISHHPWDRTIKDKYSNNIKYSHNSIHNTTYHFPKKKERLKPNKGQVKFTVVGNRVSKEFIYCVKVVQGLHKYRSRNYAAPVIRGITTVEWPVILNNLKLQYGGLVYCLSSPVVVLINENFLGGDKELKEYLESKYIYHLVIDYPKESVAQFSQFIHSYGRPCTYFHIAINDEHIGTLIFMLYADIVPRTCENFLRLCTVKKGGYSGTPIHRIVKDGWIQGGGYGLKDSGLDCENFIVPHDRRGVLGMANEYRHKNCSTQFFVLLQPAPWMKFNYVAFGQLIDGAKILEKIESVPTDMESPTSKIVIESCGVLNLDCHDIIINKSTNSYLDGHVEDLVEIGIIFIRELLNRVYLEAEFRRIARLEQYEEMWEENSVILEQDSKIRPTQRFNRPKEEIHSQLAHSQNTRKSSATSKTSENKDFDVDNYSDNYEPEEFLYKQITPPPSVILEKKPFYIPLTDVPYFGEKDSTYDLKKLLKGDYCLESDLDESSSKQPKLINDRTFSYPSDLFNFFNEDYPPNKTDKEYEEDEDEVAKYLKENIDRISFAGDVIRTIAKGARGMVNLFENSRKSELITDEELRRFRLASIDARALGDKKVSICVPFGDTGIHKEVKRRQTGFVRPEDVKKLFSKEDYEEEDEYKLHQLELHERKVSISVPDTGTGGPTKIKRRQTGFMRPEDLAKLRLTQPEDEDDQDEEPLPSPQPYQYIETEKSPKESKKKSSRFASDDTHQIHVFEDVKADRKQSMVEDKIKRTPGYAARKSEDVGLMNQSSSTSLIKPLKTSKVRLAPTTIDHKSHIHRRPTAFVRKANSDEDDDEDDEVDVDDDGDNKPRPSVLARLLDEMRQDSDTPAPTLKDYKPINEIRNNKTMLTYSPLTKLDTIDDKDTKYKRQSLLVEESLEDVLNLQHGKKVARKISSDYVNTIDHIERRPETSIRSVEFSKTRPAMSVAEYQQKNILYEEASKKPTSSKRPSQGDTKQQRGLRLPGDSPLYMGSKTK